MQRRHKQSTELDDVPVLTDSIETEEDIPVLSDIDPPPAAWTDQPEPLRAKNESEVTSSPAVFDNSLRDIVAHELARRIEQRLIAALPGLIESTVCDFLAEREMITKLQAREG